MKSMFKMQYFCIMFLINPFRDPKPVLPVSNRHTEILLRSHPDYVCSPLLELPALAADLGIGNLSLKDERQRLRLGSFKALGGFSAIAELVMRETGIGPEEIYTINACYAARQLTFCCASSGNHGKAVAAAAGLLGAKAIVFVPEKLSARRLQGITDQQARVILVPGSYDQAVARAYHQAIANNWILVPDTSEDAADPVVGFVMDGYRVMAKELFSQLSQPPTHLVLQGGVGGMAAGIATEFRAKFPNARLSIIIVEPENAACLMESIRAGHPVSLKKQPETGISMLACYR